MELSNEDLFLLAWHAPMTRVAAAIGVSDVALKKTYRNRGIPTPPRGHWAKVQAGLAVPHPPRPVSVGSASPLKLNPRAEMALLEMLRDARTSTTADSDAVVPRALGDDTARSVATSPDTESNSAAAPSFCAAAVNGGCPSLLALVDIEAFRVHRCREQALSQLQERSIALPTTERLQVEVCLAQARLEIERSDPARALLSKLLGA